jgi:hypothetical protein
MARRKSQRFSKEYPISHVTYPPLDTLKPVTAEL